MENFDCVIGLKFDEAKEIIDNKGYSFRITSSVINNIKSSYM